MHRYVGISNNIMPLMRQCMCALYNSHSICKQNKAPSIIHTLFLFFLKDAYVPSGQPRALAVLMRWHSPTHADYFRVRHATYASQLASEALATAAPMIRSGVSVFIGFFLALVMRVW